MDHVLLSDANLTYQPWMYSGDLDSVFKDGTAFIAVSDAQWVHTPRKASEGSLTLAELVEGAFVQVFHGPIQPTSCSVHT